MSGLLAFVKRYRLFFLVGAVLALLLVFAGEALWNLATRGDDQQGLGVWPTATPDTNELLAEQNVALAWQLECWFAQHAL
jgi:hypothetical protein